MKRKHLTGAAVALLGSLLLAQYLLAVQSSAGRQTQGACSALEVQPVHQPAHRFTLPDLQGTQHRLQDHRGRLVLLNFWATWCPPCVEELPSLAALQQRLQGRPVSVITVNVDEDRETLERFWAQQPENVRQLPVWHNPDRSVATAYGTTKFPETFFIDPDGQVLFKLIYKRDWMGPQAIGCIDSLLSSL